MIFFFGWDMEGQGGDRRRRMFQIEVIIHSDKRNSTINQTVDRLTLNTEERIDKGDVTMKGGKKIIKSQEFKKEGSNNRISLLFFIVCVGFNYFRSR